MIRKRSTMVINSLLCSIRITREPLPATTNGVIVVTDINSIGYKAVACQL